MVFIRDVIRNCNLPNVSRVAHAIHVFRAKTLKAAISHFENMCMEDVALDHFPYGMQTQLPE